MREARRLREYHFDTGLLLPNSFRAAWTLRLAGVPRRAGYARDGRGWLLSDRIPLPAGERNRPLPQIQCYLKLVEALGVIPSDDPAPRLAPPVREVGRAAALLQAGGIDLSLPLALLNPGASKAGKRWPLDRFAALADLLHDRHGMQVLLNGSPGERDLTRAIAMRVERASVLDLAPLAATLGTLSAVCGLANLIVTNDTGTRHVAAAVGFERLRRGEPPPGIVTLFGEVPPEWTTLHYPHEMELYDRRTRRVESIGVEQVVEACRRLTETLTRTTSRSGNTTERSR